MEQNKTGKYLKYAIGEIVLVVVGILIELSINNWNERRKLLTSEQKLLIELLTDLEITGEELEVDINDITNIINLELTFYRL